MNRLLQDCVVDHTIFWGLVKGTVLYRRKSFTPLRMKEVKSGINLYRFLLFYQKYTLLSTTHVTTIIYNAFYNIKRN